MSERSTATASVPDDDAGAFAALMDFSEVLVVHNSPGPASRWNTVNRFA
jgi:hypothetical protein